MAESNKRKSAEVTASSSLSASESELPKREQRHNPLIFLFYVASIYLTFLGWGLFQEKLVTQKYCSPCQDGRVACNCETFTSTVLLNLAMSVTAWIGGALCLLFPWARAKSLRPEPTELQFIKVAFTNSIASPIGYLSLGYINYPTLILAKMSKLIPVMFLGTFIYHKKYKSSEYLSAFLITVGVSAFSLLKGISPEQFLDNIRATYSNSSVSLHTWTQLIGLGLVALNLLLDGTTNTQQDALFETTNLSSFGLMCHMNKWSSIMMFGYLLLTQIPGLIPGSFGPTLSESISFCLRYPEAMRDVIWFGVLGTLGQVVLFRVIEEYGSLTNITVTITRKMFTLLLSIYVYEHSINLLQAVGAAMVCVGLAVNLGPKFREAPRSKHDKSK
jgi:UDP-galactose transporter B1